MLTRSRTNRLSALSATLVAGLVALPLVVAFAIDPEQTGKTPAKGQQSVGAQAAILRGRVTNKAGAPLADVRVRVAIPAADMRFVMPAKHTSNWKPNPVPMATTGWRSPESPTPRRSQSTQ